MNRTQIESVLATVVEANRAIHEGNPPDAAKVGQALREAAEALRGNGHVQGSLRDALVMLKANAAVLAANATDGALAALAVELINALEVTP